MANGNYSVTFRIMGENLIPDDVSSLLDLQPSFSHKKGDDNTQTSKKGKIIQYTPFKFGLWALDSDLEKSVPLNEHIEHILEKISPHKEKILTLKTECKLDIFCGCFLDMTIQPGFLLSGTLLKEISHLDIDLDFCFYQIN